MLLDWKSRADRVKSLPSGLFFFVFLLIANLGGNNVTKNEIISINNARFATNRDFHWCDVYSLVLSPSCNGKQLLLVQWGWWVLSLGKQLFSKQFDCQSTLYAIISWSCVEENSRFRARKFIDEREILMWGWTNLTQTAFLQAGYWAWCFSWKHFLPAAGQGAQEFSNSLVENK